MKDYPSSERINTDRLTRQKTKRKKIAKAKFLAVWLILVLVAMFFTQQRIEYIRTEQIVKDLLVEKRKIMSLILPLKLEERYLTQLKTVEKIAAERLYLQKPKKNQIIKVYVKESAKNP